MSFKKMDPSCTIGFYCRNVQDFEKVAEEVSRVLKSSSKEKYPLFTFVQGHSKDYDFESAPAHGQNDLLAEDERKRLQRFNTDDFVLL